MNRYEFITGETTVNFFHRVDGKGIMFVSFTGDEGSFSGNVEGGIIPTGMELDLFLQKIRESGAKVVFGRAYQEGVEKLLKGDSPEIACDAEVVRKETMARLGKLGRAKIEEILGKPLDQIINDTVEFRVQERNTHRFLLVDSIRRLQEFAKTYPKIGYLPNASPLGDYVHGIGHQ